MIRCEELIEWMAVHGVDFYTGVPDSVLKQICFYLEEHAGDNHVVTANEGGAVALATGHHLATGSVPLVYLQNSGLGNMVNPLLSLAHKEVYSIPMLLLIGWRGEPGQHDEPQHMKQGKIMARFLEEMDIPHRVMSRDPKAARQGVDELLTIAKEESRPVALVVRKNSFEPYETLGERVGEFEMTREQALEAVVSTLDERDAIVSSTGKISRELYEYRDRNGQGHHREFLTVGSMGHASQIALGIALAQPEREVYCLEGDGAMLMHMGGAAIVGAAGPSNFKHVIINNGVHDSVGGMAVANFKHFVSNDTVHGSLGAMAVAGLRVSFGEIVMACGYTDAWRVERPEDLPAALEELRSAKGPAMLEIMVKQGARPDLGRPKTSPIENKTAFTEFLAD